VVRFWGNESLGCLLFLQSLSRPVEYRLKGAWILYRELG
jgi:hypothetical protein